MPSPVAYVCVVPSAFVSRLREFWGGLAEHVSKVKFSFGDPIVFAKSMSIRRYAGIFARKQAVWTAHSYSFGLLAY